ncbi:MAG: Na+/H+ antiporter NhaA [Thermodesulfobacteriota bacterium]|nr:Na+/H+ antiporter NhaA [Thermodesulfobacteriota bacterium]
MNAYTAKNNGKDLIKAFSPVQIIGPFQKFFNKIVSGSYPLFIAAIIALFWANFFGESYHSVWHTELAFSIGSFHISKSLLHWINDALMTIFFFVVGLEIKRELLVGELASIKKAILPIAAAIGGMLVPGAIYAVLNYNTAAASGWAIPMATDIAFSLAVLAIVGKKIPFGIRIFLSAFAIADDLGAVLIIAVFYTQSIAWNYIMISLVLIGSLALANLLWIRWTLVYALLGICIWVAIMGSGIHATIAGVIVALFIPAKGRYDTRTFIDKVNASLNQFDCKVECGHTILLNKDHQSAVQNIELACHDVETPLQRLFHGLDIWVAFLILPLFALSNAGVSLDIENISYAMTHPVGLGILLGLVLGKPLGITLFTFLAVKLLKVPLLSGIHWHHIIGASMLGGIGFTMSLFISGLSFSSFELIEISKIGILSASILSGIFGITVLKLNIKL